MMREIAFYDGINDVWFVRHDVLCAHGKPDEDGAYALRQSGCDHRCTCGPSGDIDESWLERARIKSRHALGRHIGRLGVESMCKLDDPFPSTPGCTTWVDPPVLPFAFNGNATRRKTHSGAK